MQDATLAVAENSASNNTETTNNRQQLLEQLFIRLYPEVKQALLSDPLLSVTEFEVESAMENLAYQLPDYQGELTEEGLLEWALDVTLPFVSKEALYRQYHKAVLKGVWTVLTANTDLGVDDGLAAELAQNAWYSFIVKEKFRLLNDRTALVSWFIQLGRNEARAWKTAQLRKRERFGDLKERMPYPGRVAYPRPQ